MLSEPFEAAVFIGGMEGIFEEHRMFSELHPNATVVTLSAPGGAAMQLAKKIRQRNNGIDFGRIFHKKLKIEANEPRDQV